MAEFELPVIPENTTLQVIEDFDVRDLEMVLDEVYGEGAGKNMIKEVKKEAEQSGLDWDDFTSTPESTGSIVTRVMQKLILRGEGEDSIRQLSRTITQYHTGQEVEEDGRLLDEIVAYGVPKNGSEALMQVDSMMGYLMDTFKEDRAMRNVISEAYAQMVSSTGLQGVNMDDPTGSAGLSSVDPTAFNTETLIKNLKASLDPSTRSSLSRVYTEEEATANVVLLDALHAEWESGRSDLPFDHPMRDPQGIVKEVEEANNSPRSRDLLADNRVAMREIQFLDPAVEFGLTQLTEDKRYALEEALARMDSQNRTEQEKREYIETFMNQTKEVLVDYLWESSSLREDPFSRTGESDPADVINTKLTKSHIDRMLGINPTSVASNILKGGSVSEGLNAAEEAGRRFFADPEKNAGLANRGKFEAEGPVTMGELNEYFFKMSDAKFRELQLGAWQSGAYGNTDIADIPFGIRTDEIARAQWNNAILETRNSQRLGFNVTLEDILERASAGGLEVRRRQAEDLRDQAAFQRDSATAASSETIAIEVSDPLTIIGKADAMAQQILGRNATPEERKLLVGVVRSREREDQVAKARFTAGQRASAQLEQALLVEQQAVALESQIEREIREAEIRSRSITNTGVREATPDGMEIPDANTLDQYVNRELELQQNAGQTAPAANQTTGTSAGGNVSIREFQDFDSNAFMENWLKQNNAGEVQALGVRDSFQTFLNALRAPVR
jgi:hypothetical protein